MTSAGLRIDRVNKSFRTRDGGDLEVLRDISIDIRPGSIHAILGTSGCGKSTLLHLIAGLTAFEQGRIEIGGTGLDRFTDWRRIGYAFQDDRLLPWRTVLGNVALALEAAGLPRVQRLRRSREVLSMVGLVDFETAFPHELSGGMRSRVALARSLALEPRILLMDEPFSRLDAQTRQAMHAEVLRLRGLFDMTVLFVTHDVEEAAVLADDITVLAPRPGRVIDSFSVTAPRPRESTSAPVAEVIRRLKSALGAVLN
jgi:ABC-type nitrate/sulfonate/bicarbonate transport system, ATPase component